MEKLSQYSLTTFNQEGRLTQIDNAIKGVSISNSIIALKTKKCVILISQINSSTILSDTSLTSRIFLINNRIGIAGSGLYPDLRILVKRARRQARIFQSNFGEEISSRQLSKEISLFIQEFTQAGGVRVFGVILFIVGFDIDGPSVYQIDSSGLFSKIRGGAIGKNSNIAIELIKKRLSDSLNFDDVCKVGLTIFQEISDVPISDSSIYFAGITDSCFFKIYSPHEIEIIIKKKNTFP